MSVPEGMEVIPNGWDTPVHGYPLGERCWWTKTVDRGDNWVGILHWHPGPDGSIHAGGVNFDTEHGRAAAGRAAVWQVESLDPLTISPSVLCSCGHHGFIRNGRWESA